MRYLLITTTVCCLATGTLRGEDIYSTMQHPPAKRLFANLLPLYQNWSLKDSSDISEITVPVFVHYQLNRNLGLSFRGSHASAEGDHVQTLSGLTDTQLDINYRPQNYNFVFHLGFSLPSGQRELTEEEFETSILVSNNIFNFRRPNFGQGLNVTAGVSWAQSLSDNVVLGLGVSYHLKGKFRPLRDLPDDYTSGDEILLTGGFDLRLNNTTTFSSDLILTFFGTDKLGTDGVFAPGNRLVLNAQFRKYFGFNEFWLFTRYRTRTKNERAVVTGGALLTEEERTFPNQLEVRSHFRKRFNDNFYARLLLEGRFYQEAPAFQSFEQSLISAGVNLVGFGVAPEFRLSENLTLPVVLKYFTGSFGEGPDISGLEVNSGVILELR